MNAENAPDFTAPDVQDVLRSLVTTKGTPSYVYFSQHIAARVAALRSAFSGLFDISYAVKSNPNRAIVRQMGTLADHLDISSAGELMIASEAAWSPSDMSFVGPAKTDWELEYALQQRCGHLVVESIGELDRINRLAAEQGVCCDVVLRINPQHLPKGFGVSMSQVPTIFGIDEEHVDEAIVRAEQLDCVSFKGFHVYAGTQCLDEASIAENLINTADLYSRLISKHKLQASILIFGSGFGIPYHDRDRPIDVEEIAHTTRATLSTLRDEKLATGGRMLLEMGRFLVGESGVFVAQVLSVKDTRGAQILAIDGGMNHFLGASGNLGSIVKRNYPVFNLSKVHCDDDCEYTIVGPLCTNIDTLARMVRLPRTEAGDYIGIACAGAYGLTASPVNFISHRPPFEFIVDSDSKGSTVTDITSMGPGVSPPGWQASHRNGL